jgi:riboflavin biosynthesis pyrimidine reductase
VRLRRLHPEPGEIDALEAVAELAGRDVLAVNMVASADGRAAYDGKTAPLSDAADREVFHLLRAQADAILVGTGTLRTERYGRFTKDDRRRDIRTAAGLDPEPYGVTLSRSLDLPYEIPLFQDPGARIVVYTDSDRDAEPCPARVDIVRLDDLDPRAVVAHLRREYDVRCIVSEGGPTLNGPFFAAGVVDELFLCVAPVLTGGRRPLTILDGDLPAAISLQLRQAIEHEGSLLLRYAVRPAG